MRTAAIARTTTETDISLKLCLDGSGKSVLNTGCGFLDHMLTLFAKHGRFDLEVNCKGDVEVDYHHTAEDIAIVLGEAFKSALGDKKGINRYASEKIPMDEALVCVTLDISGRCGYFGNLAIPAPKVGDFDTELVDEFMYGLCRALGLNLHIEQIRGSNSHHIIEGVFKALGRAMRTAVAIDAKFANDLPSTKGML